VAERFCLDTSFLINGWHKRYRIDVFPSLWDTLSVLMQAGTVFSCHDVYLELQHQDDELLVWAKERAAAFEKPTEEVLAELARIMGRFSNFAAQGGAKNRADPFVIAHARVDGAIVVTDEQWADRQKATKPPKVPNACDALGVSWMRPIDFLGAIDIKL
jgi:hypothetical protein